MIPTAEIPPTAIVILGGTGDLSQTKLLPALFDLYRFNQLPVRFHILGLSRQIMTDEEYRQFVHRSLKQKGVEAGEEQIADFCSHFYYQTGDFGQNETYQAVRQRLVALDELIGQCSNKLFYLAVPPQFYETIFTHLHQSEVMALCDGELSWSRLLVEKPFGRDLRTAQALEKKLCSLFSEEQIYRIDHYLAKEAIENIIALRFMNSLFAESWNGQAIESITIRLFETKDVSNRGAFYDAIGTLRDVGQNHLLQIFALLTMDYAPLNDAKAIHRARADALRDLCDHLPDTIIRGQYDGYHCADGVADGSQTETYFKLGWTLQTGKWNGTKIILEAGKALDKQINQAVVTYRAHNTVADATKNVLTISFAPRQHIDVSLWTKAPGFDFRLREQKLVIAEDESAISYSPEAYERVLYDCIAGDQTRFVSGEEVELAWHFITPILEQFQQLPLHTYSPGSVGPVVE